MVYLKTFCIAFSKRKHFEINHECFLNHFDFDEYDKCVRIFILRYI